MSNTVWTINVVVNTRALAEYVESSSNKGSWEQPIGGGKRWENQVRMIATSNQPNGEVFIGNGDSFSLTVGEHDKIRWIVSEINPVVENYRSVCMYGFAKGSNWEENLTDPHAEHEEIGFMRMTTGFDQPIEPAKPYVKGTLAEISVPGTKVLHRAKDGASIQYYMKLLLLSYEDIDNPKIEGYIKIDPTITIKR